MCSGVCDENSLVGGALGSISNWFGGWSTDQVPSGEEAYDPDIINERLKRANVRKEKKGGGDEFIASQKRSPEEGDGNSNDKEL